jgi:hypothetical protein
MSAQAFLPLGKNSLKYGSSDAGITVHKDDEKLNALMEEAARRLNLRAYAVGSSSAAVNHNPDELRRRTLHAAVDIGYSLHRLGL